jgi:hypothetical protein
MLELKGWMNDRMGCFNHLRESLKSVDGIWGLRIAAP